MARTESKATVIVAGSTLQFTQAGSYTIEYLTSGNVQIKLDGGKATILKAADYAAITSFSFAPGATLDSAVRIDGVTFHEADATGPFEINYDLNNLIGRMLTDHGLDWTVDHLVVNGSAGDTLKVLWDYLDDAFVAGGNPFNVALNETFVRLGLRYVDYLEGGGEPFTFVTAKFTPDSPSDPDLIPEREQSMHDNLLGNLTSGAINVRFTGALKAELLALIPDEYEARLLYEGNDTQVAGPRHDNVRAFDYDHGWDRPDYLDRSYDAVIDPLARNGSQMYYGSGNPTDDWNVARHEGAQVELGLKVKHRGGDEYQEYSIGPDGVATYHVATGSQIGNAARAEWNFDFAASDYSPGHDFTYLVELDIDPGPGVLWSTVYSTANPDDTKFGTGATFQNSSNIAFYSAPNPTLERPGIDTDPGTTGVQPYAFGDGTFNVRISAFDAVTHAFVVSNEVVVIVGDGNPFG